MKRVSRMRRSFPTAVITLSVWVVLDGGPRAESLAAGILFDVSVSDPQNRFDGLQSNIESNVLAAARLWGQRLDGNSSIEILVQPSSQVPRATASSVVTSFIRASGGFNLFQQGMAAELKSGFDPNGAAPDVEILLSPDFARDEMWFDPNPGARTDAVDPDRTDAVSVFLHELGHAVGFNGWIDGTTGQYPGISQSTFDQLTTFDGTNFFFVGPQARALYGGDVPLTFGDPIHVGNSAPRPGADLIPDLMNGVTFGRGVRYDISPLDLAMLDDIGVPLSTDQPPHVTNLFIRGKNWSDELLSFVGDQAVGDTAFGVQVNGATQLEPQPWTNIDEISIRFDEPVQVDFADLQVRGASAAAYILDPAGFDYDSDSLTATWRLDLANPFFPSDQVQVVLASGAGGVTDRNGNWLDGEWTDGAVSSSSGDGVAGGDFVFRLDVLPGDVNRSRTVSVTDLVNVGSRAGTDVGSTPGAYEIHHDVNGDATIDVSDLTAVIAEVKNYALTGASASRVSADFDRGGADNVFFALALTDLPSFAPDETGQAEWTTAPMPVRDPGLANGLEFAAPVNSVPEPSSLLLVLTALMLAATSRQRFTSTTSSLC